MANETAMLETSRCFECGADTLRDGFVNRVPVGRTRVDGYYCGPCADTMDDSCEEDDDGKLVGFDDDAYDTYLVERIAEVDVSDPEARTWRERMERLSEGD